MSELNEIIVDENKEIQPTAIQSSIDKITMELMMNRTHYKKYLLKQDPIKYKENQEYILKIQKYENKFANLMAELLQDSIKTNVSEKYTRDINDTFNEFLKTCIQHFEICELEQGVNDSDILFDQDSMNSTKKSTSTINPHHTMDMFVMRIPP